MRSPHEGKIRPSKTNPINAIQQSPKVDRALFRWIAPYSSIENERQEAGSRVFRSSTWPQRRFHSEARRHAFYSDCITKRSAALHTEPECLNLQVWIVLAHGNRLRFPDRQTPPAIIRNGAVDNGAAIHAFPCIKHEKEIREPLQHHHSLTLRTFH